MIPSCSWFRCCWWWRWKCDVVDRKLLNVADWWSNALLQCRKCLRDIRAGRVISCVRSKCTCGCNKMVKTVWEQTKAPRKAMRTTKFDAKPIAAGTLAAT